MKLATLRDGTRDGRLVVVSRDLTACLRRPPGRADAAGGARRLGAGRAASCELIARGVEHGAAPTERFHEREAHSPLPRAYQWADGSAYVNHVELVRKARGAEMPPEFWTDPLIYQGGSDAFLDPREPIRWPTRASACDLEAEVAVITGDVPHGRRPRQPALAAIRLVMLVNDVSLRNLIPGELAKGFGFFQSKPSSAFSPVAVTPDELGDAWRDGKLHGALRVDLNGQPFGRADAGIDMTFDFGTLIAHAARTRPLRGRHDHRLGHRLEPRRRRRPGPADRRRRRRLFLHRRAAHGGDHPAGAPRRRSSPSATRCASRCATPPAHSIFGAIEQRVEPLRERADDQGLRLPGRPRREDPAASRRSAPASTPSPPRATRTPASSSATTRSW